MSIRLFASMVLVIAAACSKVAIAQTNAITPAFQTVEDGATVSFGLVYNEGNPAMAGITGVIDVNGTPGDTAQFDATTFACTAGAGFACNLDDGMAVCAGFQVGSTYADGTIIADCTVTLIAGAAGGDTATLRSIVNPDSFSDINGTESMGFSSNGTVTVMNEIVTIPMLDGSYAGSWWNPDRGGEGIFFEIIEQDGPDLVIAYFFTYDDAGNQAYVVAQGPVDGNRVAMLANVTSGGMFGADFDPSQVQFESWGVLEAIFECNALTLNYSNGTETGTINMVRFKDTPRGVAGACAHDPSLAGAGVSAIDGAYFGAWWDPDRSGEGIFMEIAEDEAGLPNLFAAWFSYAPDDSGVQRWIVGEGPLVGNTADLAAIVTSGPSFGSAFDPTLVEFEPFEFFSVEFTACGQAVISYNDPTFGSGELTQQLFVGPIIGAPPCP